MLFEDAIHPAQRHVTHVGPGSHLQDYLFFAVSLIAQHDDLTGYAGWVVVHI
jgi:hypothetical protein